MLQYVKESVDRAYFQKGKGKKPKIYTSELTRTYWFILLVLVK